MTDQVAGPVVGEDGLARCPWGAGSEVYRAYHDTEWGVPVHGEAAYLERLTLEAFQSGLSWLTILNKREAFREVFAGFDADVVAAYDEADFDRLMGDARIVRNRLKVRAAITNARATVDLRERGGLEDFVRSFRPEQQPAPESTGQVDSVSAGVGGPVEGPEEGGVRLRRPDDDVRPDAGDRHRGRPSRGMSSPGICLRRVSRLSAMITPFECSLRSASNGDPEKP